MGLFQFSLEVLGKAPDPSALSPGEVRTLPHWVTLATWMLEALGLSALFLLIQSRSGRNWTTGLLTGWIAWIFRGPLLVVTVAGLAGLPPGPWWSMTFEWWILYSLCGLLLGGTAAAAGLRPEQHSASVAPLPFPEPARRPAEPFRVPAEGPVHPPEHPVSPLEAPPGSPEASERPAEP